jgi:hypothetical protein
MKTIEVVFAYDVEDVAHPESDDAVKRICEIHTAAEVPASLFIAGEKARVIRQRGRHDVIRALQGHEICYHGNYWGDFPEPALSYGARLPFDEAVRTALSIELPGLHDVAEITGQYPVAWCCHQAQQCPPLAYALKLAGVRCWAGGPRGYLMNWLSWPRSGCALSSQGSWSDPLDPTRRDQFKPPADPAADLAAVQQQFEQMAATKDFLTFVGHPVCWVNADWNLYDYAVLFRHGSAGPYPRPFNPRPARPRSQADREAAFELLERLLQWVKNRPEVNLTSYTQMCERDEEDPVQWLAWEQVVALAREVPRHFNYQVAAGTSFSCADLLGLLVFGLDYCWRYGVWPDRAPVQRLLGPTETPLEVATALTLSREELFAGALAAYAFMLDERRVPGKLRASFTDVGPAQLLHALAAFVVQVADSGELPLTIEVPPVPTLPACVSEPVITDRRFGSSNRPPDFDFAPLWDLLRWQSWSYRPAVPKDAR